MTARQTDRHGTLKTVRIRVYGIVQGIGFRPFVRRLADELGIEGTVCNKGSYVEIFARAKDARLREFTARLKSDAPAVSVILRVEVSTLPDEEASSVPGPAPGYPAPVPDGDAGSDKALKDRFRILPSRHEEGDVYVSPDLAVCPDCLRELYDPNDRRYLHPFINCTNCGPRLTILDAMPYDRERTSMAEFPMCRKCRDEYTDPADRRFHAQPVCCPEDGPHLFVPYLNKNIPKQVSENASPKTAAPSAVSVTPPGSREGDDAAIRLVRRILRKGGIAAIKGIGGFHLAADATNEAAVRRLRTLKHRPVKPFAVMMRDLPAVQASCDVPESAEKILTGVQKPILILSKKTDAPLAPSVAPDNPSVGVMLPYAPLQALIFHYPDGEPDFDALVMTSGNPSGAPICRTTEEAVRYLSPMCDVILSHNRVIRTRCDDSVMQLWQGQPYMVRRSRGYAPLPFFTKERREPVLAIGGELKNTFTLTKDGLLYPSAYVGDLADPRAVEALKQSVERMERLLEVTPARVVCDLHPRYHSTAFARRYAASRGIPVTYVQHHYAHILSCMAENEYDGDVIGVSFDGTGYGTDGTIWGGEFLKASVNGFVRLGSLMPFDQSGGDLAAKEGWRVAVSLLGDAGLEDLALTLHLCDEKTLHAQQTMRRMKLNTIQSTSAGRLFDAVSAILGIRKSSTFEGEASTALEFRAEAYLNRKKSSEPDKSGPDDANESVRSFSAGPDEDVAHLIRFIPYAEKSEDQLHRGMGYSDRRFAADFRPLVRYLATEKANGHDPDALALIFHVGMAELIRQGCLRMREETGLNTVALSGGVFQNLLLLTLTCERLEKDGFHVLTHHLIPPNDGGISLGQAYAEANTGISSVK